jgi:hypothetical protein
MGLQFSQLHISRDKDYAPSAAAVSAFLSEIIALGVVPGARAIVLRVRSGKTREYPNPFTGGTVTVELKDSTQLNALEQLESAAADLIDFEVELSGVGRPKLPPLEIDFAEPYYVGVTCFVSSILRSTSADSYGKPCDFPSIAGVFQNPESGETIEIPEAGAARFWVEFELGKFLCPKIDNGNLDLLDPAIVAVAQRSFDRSFVQGCLWG